MATEAEANGKFLKKKHSLSCSASTSSTCAVNVTCAAQDEITSLQGTDVSARFRTCTVWHLQDATKELAHLHCLGRKRIALSSNSPIGRKLYGGGMTIDVESQTNAATAFA
jgi:hypothetical protein